MNGDFSNQCRFLQKETGLDLTLCARLMRSVYRDKLALYAEIRKLGQYAQGRRRRLFGLCLRIKNGYHLTAEGMHEKEESQAA
jgi:hypothetical protein